MNLSRNIEHVVHLGFLTLTLIGRVVLNLALFEFGLNDIIDAIFHLLGGMGSSRVCRRRLRPAWPS